VITAIYASLCALLIIRLAMRVITLRWEKRVKFGDGEHPDLNMAIRAHGNASEYIPIALILLFLLEYNGLHPLLIHMLGIAFVYGRYTHAKALLSNSLRERMKGMQYTLNLITAMAVANIVLALLKQLA
jgi:uncharacterized membrane protein YecN with MAPEG domain